MQNILYKSDRGPNAVNACPGYLMRFVYHYRLPNVGPKPTDNPTIAPNTVKEKGRPKENCMLLD